VTGVILSGAKNLAFFRLLSSLSFQISNFKFEIASLFFFAGSFISNLSSVPAVPEIERLNSLDRYRMRLYQNSRAKKHLA
jgi:hypothetical protein